MSFDSTGLDPRLLRALSKRGFEKPTPVQVRLGRPPGAWRVAMRSSRVALRGRAARGPPGAAAVLPPPPPPPRRRCRRRTGSWLNVAAPTPLLPPLQAECIPKALEGRDIVARARTGSGKTLAYLLPALHRVLASGKGKAGWQALVLVPTRELCEQVRGGDGGGGGVVTADRGSGGWG